MSQAKTPQPWWDKRGPQGVHSGQQGKLLKGTRPFIFVKGSVPFANMKGRVPFNQRRASTVSRSVRGSTGWKWMSATGAASPGNCDS